MTNNVLITSESHQKVVSTTGGRCSSRFKEDVVLEKRVYKKLRKLMRREIKENFKNIFFEEQGFLFPITKNEPKIERILG